MQYLAEELSHALRHNNSNDNLFQRVAGLKGETFREIESRKTLRVRLGERYYFVKTHFGVGWKEILKNLAQFKLPVLSAQNEWNAIRKLDSLGIDTMVPVGFARYGNNPAAIRSFIITRELENTESLEDLCVKWNAEFRQKFRLLKKVSEIVRRLHENGINHQDLYICHFLMDLATRDSDEPRLFLIDLHRAQIRNRVPERWRVKDVGAIFFSCFDIGINRRDIFRFMKVYSGKNLRDTLREDAGFWRSVLVRAKRLYLKIHVELPEWVLALDE